MSQIAVSGNASGTGTFTIASPNSNTNRTLTLPDASGTLNTSGAANEVPAGSAGSPAIYPTGDTNTGIFFPAADTIAFAEGGAEVARFDASGNLGLGVTPSAWRSSYRAMEFGRTGNYIGGTTTSTMEIGVNAYVDSANAYRYANTGVASLYYQASGAHQWFTASSGTAGNAISFINSMNLTSGGLLQVGITSLGSGLINTTTASGLWGIVIRDTASNTAMVQFLNASNAQAGSITISGTTTTYGSGSDYRLKEEIVPMTGALEKVQALKPVTWKWKADGSDGQGFIAHELSAVCPDAVVGEKDAVNEDGSIKPQMVDTSFLVATLTAAIQEQQAMIQTLTARIEALEAK